MVFEAKSSRMDSMSLANKKIRVDMSKLESELHRISREKRTVMRLLNNEKQRFKSKYSKLDVFAEHRGSEPSDVVMYETHNPGFCYRRNGECRMPQSPIKNTSLGFEDIHVLIFTDGELDLDKVLCLHLLSTHRTETLTPPPKTHRTAIFISKQQSPLERLIDRCKKRWPEDKLTRLLPIYVLDYVRNNPFVKYDNFIRDGRLAARLIVNEKINILIRSVMSALNKSNQDLLTSFIDKAKNQSYLKQMLSQPKMQEYIKNLNGLNVLSCCESFCLTTPFRIVPIILDIKTPTGHLENLLKQIRKNLFQMPMNCTWEEEISCYNVYSDSEDDSSSNASSYYQNEKEIFSQNLNLTDFRAKGNRTRSRTVNKTQTLSVISDEDDDVPKTPRTVILSRKRSLSSAPAEEMMEMKAAEKIDSPRTSLDLDQMRSMDFEKMAVLLFNKANTAIKKEIANLAKSEPVEDKLPSQKLPTSTISLKPEIPKIEDKTKVYLKQTKCAACREKWKQPLPAPKTSHVHKHSESVVDNDTMATVMSHSSHIISTLIDEELRYWNDYKVSRNGSDFSSPRYWSSPRNFDKGSVIEIIDLDELDLAKVRQEIREHETKKKLDNFLHS